MTVKKETAKKEPKEEESSSMYSEETEEEEKEMEPEVLGGSGAVKRCYKYIARLGHFYNLLTKCCNLPYKWC